MDGRKIVQQSNVGRKEQKKKKSRHEHLRGDYSRDVLEKPAVYSMFSPASSCERREGKSKVEEKEENVRFYFKKFFGPGGGSSTEEEVGTRWVDKGGRTPFSRKAPLAKGGGLTEERCRTKKVFDWRCLQGGIPLQGRVLRPEGY